jgi:hypothetical protein
MFVLPGHGRTVLRDLTIYALRPTPNTVRICPDPGFSPTSGTKPIG